jgi:predicted NBD/HSP70 family sugar kinase
VKNSNNGSNQTTIKSSNRSLILRLLNSLGQVSRAELSRITGLTRMSVSNITGELIEKGIIYETGTMESSSGRKPILLNLSKNALYALGLYISRDFAYCNIANLKGEIIREARRPFNPVENERTFLEAVFGIAGDVLEASGVQAAKILGAGVACIGPLDVRNGVILDPTNFRGLKSIPIVKALRDRFNMEAFLDNDMNAGAIAEKLYGKGRNVSDFVYVGVTNGIGAGIIANGNIFRGCSGFAGEIGHTTVDIRGDRCACGNIGCLEMYASIPSIVNQVKSSVRLGGESSFKSEGDVSWNAIVSAASEGDQLCLRAIDGMVYYLSAGLVNTVNSFDPEVVFLGHEIALAGELVTKPLNDIINRSVLFRNSKRVNVELSAFRDYAPCIGAPSIVLNKFFNGEIG